MLKREAEEMVNQKLQVYDRKASGASIQLDEYDSYSHLMP